MKLNNFDDFLKKYPKYGKFANNSVAEQIFKTMSGLQEIQSMLLASESDKPALSACVSNLEKKYGNQSIFDFNDDFSKQAVGAMIKVILEPFGYIPIKQKRISPTVSKYFTSASVYKQLQHPRLKIIQKLEIEPVE